jgi:F0F1-type ATP synthase epsilon subunit
MSGEDWKKNMVAEKGKMLFEVVAPSRQVVRSEHVDEVIILAEGADRAMDINLDEARLEKERAEKALGGHLEQKDYEKARIELLRAMIRVQVAEKHAQK